MNMPDVGKILSVLGITFFILSFVFNFFPRRIRIPGDIDINRSNINIYIPWLSSIVISVILTLIFNFFKK